MKNHPINSEIVQQNTVISLWGSHGVHYDPSDAINYWAPLMSSVPIKSTMSRMGPIVAVCWFGRTKNVRITSLINIYLNSKFEVFKNLA